MIRESIPLSFGEAPAVVDPITELRFLRISLNAVARTMDPKDWRRDQLNDQIERIDRALSPHPQP